MWPNSQETADLVTFTGEIVNEKLHFFAVRDTTVSKMAGIYCLFILLPGNSHRHYTKLYLWWTSYVLT